MLEAKFEPRDVVLNEPIPLCATMGKTEREVAAALYVLHCQGVGAWVRVTPREMGETVKKHLGKVSWLSNPFLAPAVSGPNGIIEHGYVTLHDDNSIEATPKFFDAITRWVRRGDGAAA